MGIINGFEVMSLAGVQAYLDYFNVRYDPISEKEKFLEALNENIPTSAAGLVRWELAADQTKWPEEAVIVIMNAAKALRMLISETPIEGDFDIAIAMGGANQAQLVRGKDVMAATSRGCRIPELILPGSVRRVLKDAERENVKNYAPNAKTEFDLAKGVFDRLAPESGNTTIRLYRIDIEEAYNYNVIDCILNEYYDSAKISINPRICVVTTQIYWMALWLDLLRIARKHEISLHNIFAAGTPSAKATIDGRSPLTYAFEINRTIQAAVEEIASALKY